MELFDRDKLYQLLSENGFGQWTESLRKVCEETLDASQHGTLSKWMDAWKRLPTPRSPSPDAGRAPIASKGRTPLDQDELREVLMQFHPWRKGPFEFLGIKIDAEWRSDLKWERLAQHVDFSGKAILDVGCGNGYYGWRMIDAGADFVLGCDPLLLYVMQFEVLRKVSPAPERNFVVPLADHQLPAGPSLFDMTCSLGVLYHRASPIEHLQKLWSTLKPGGELILETLVVESDGCEVLMPEDRYARMRNVWFIPSMPMLERWLMRTGYRDVTLIDVTRTTVEEQRRTEWMTFESLSDFLDPNDPQRTIEGYPSPLRAIVSARKGNN